MSWLKRGRDKDGDQDGHDPVAWVSTDDETAEPDEPIPAPAGRSSSERSSGRSAGRLGPAARSSRAKADPVAEAVDDEYPAGSERSGDDQAESARTTGPWDVSEVAASDAYVDLGALWLPGRDGMELRLEVEEETGKVIAATVQLGGSAVQLQAFAAPRTQGIWDEIRREIASSVTRQGGTADEVPGTFGRELLARVPSRTPEGRTTHAPARFAGVDGPRWFLRAVFHGEAAYKAEQAVELESLVKEVVVVRGTEAMAPRELLALRLPDGAQGPGLEETVEDDGRDPLRPFERGPEITEVR